MLREPSRARDPLIRSGCHSWGGGRVPPAATLTGSDFPGGERPVPIGSQGPGRTFGACLSHDKGSEHLQDSPAFLPPLCLLPHEGQSGPQAGTPKGSTNIPCGWHYPGLPRTVSGQATQHEEGRGHPTVEKCPTPRRGGQQGGGGAGASVCGSLQQAAISMVQSLFFSFLSVRGPYGLQGGGSLPWGQSRLHALKYLSHLHKIICSHTQSSPTGSTPGTSLGPKTVQLEMQ